MAKSKVIYVNSSSSKVKEIPLVPSLIIFSFVVFIIILFMFSYKLSAYYLSIEKDMEIEKVNKKNEALLKEFNKVNKQIDKIKLVLGKIREIDDELRLESGLAGIDDEVRNLGIGGSLQDYYLDENLNSDQSKTLAKQKMSLDELHRKFEFEFESFKNVFTILKYKEDSLKFLPSILPIPEDLYRVTSNFGKRLHPILGTDKNHPGIDFGADIGTPVYATADGIVNYAGLNSGYGNFIKIDHANRELDFGYETRYAHLSKIFVKYGQFVKRGDLIGEIGNTGLSTAPHLHYEIRYKGNPLRPSEYYFVNIK